MMPLNQVLEMDAPIGLQRHLKMPILTNTNTITHENTLSNKTTLNQVLEIYWFSKTSYNADKVKWG